MGLLSTRPLCKSMCQGPIIDKTIMQIYVNIMQKLTLKTITESSVQGIGFVPSEALMRNLGKVEIFVWAHSIILHILN
jgi:hypothetical protein